MLGRMCRQICQILAVVAVALQLGGCIYSDYDLSSTLKPEFPLKIGTYAKDKDKIIDVRRFGDAYRVYNRSTKRTTYAHLYKIPEYPDYLFQYNDRKKKPIVYLFLKVTDKGFDVYTIDKVATAVPEHLAKLVTQGSNNSKNENEITINSGRRDTLYVVREMARAGLKMSVAESYERRP
jgi:hypothetical protein